MTTNGFVYNADAHSLTQFVRPFVRPLTDALSKAPLIRALCIGLCFVFDADAQSVSLDSGLSLTPTRVERLRL